MNIEEINKVLNGLEKYIDGRDIDNTTTYRIKEYIATLKDICGIEKKKEDEVVFSYEDKVSRCSIIKHGMDDTYTFVIIDLEAKDYDGVFDSLESYDECEYGGIHKTFEKCMKDLKDSYLSWIGKELIND